MSVDNGRCEASRLRPSSAGRCCTGFYSRVICVVILYTIIITLFFSRSQKPYTMRSADSNMACRPPCLDKGALDSCSFVVINYYYLCVCVVSFIHSFGTTFQRPFWYPSCDCDSVCVPCLAGEGLGGRAAHTHPVAPESTLVVAVHACACAPLAFEVEGRSCGMS